MHQYEQLKQQPPSPAQGDNKQVKTKTFGFSERKNPVKRINFWKLDE
jgi:hypothetical protein